METTSTPLIKASKFNKCYLRTLRHQTIWILLESLPHNIDPTLMKNNNLMIVEVAKSNSISHLIPNPYRTNMGNKTYLPLSIKANHLIKLIIPITMHCHKIHLQISIHIYKKWITNSLKIINTNRICRL